MVELLEKLVGITVFAETKVASPGSNCATSSVVNAVIQNKVKKAAETARLRVAIRFHNCIAFPFLILVLGQALWHYQAPRHELAVAAIHLFRLKYSKDS